MSDPQFNPDPPADVFSSEPEEQVKQESEQAARHEPDPELLERVLDETISAAAEGELFDAVALDQVLEVARRHPGQPLTLEPVAVDLVRTMLGDRFRRVKIPAEVWDSLSRRVAETLLDDPACHERLTALWARAAEATQ